MGQSEADVFRRTRRWKYRRAVGTHYGPTRIHQADYSPRHRRDGRAGTTILYHLRICHRAEPLQGATTGRTGLREYGATPSNPPGPQDLSGTTGRAGAADAAADAAEAAVPFGDYGPDGAADGLSRSTPRQADDTTTRPSGERADASVRCTGLGVSNTSDKAWAGYLYRFMRRFFFM